MRLGSTAFRQKLLATFFITASISAAFILVFGRKQHSIAWQNPRVETTEAQRVLGTASIATPSRKTEEIAKEIAQSILAKNPTGPALTEGISTISGINPEKIAGDVLEKRITDITRSILEPQLDTKNIKIIQTTTEESSKTYLLNRVGIVRKGAEALLAAKIDFSKPTPKNFKDLLHIYDVLIEQLYALPAPKNLAPIHIEQLRLMTAQRLIFKSLSEYNDDAITASVALSLLDAVLQQEKELGDSLNDFIQSNRLTL